MEKGTILVILGLTLIFIVDLLIPLGVAVGVLYLCFLGLLLRESSSKIIFFAIGASLLTAFVPIITTDANTTWMAYVNRVISVIAIWIAAYIALRHQKLDLESIRHHKKIAAKNRELEQFTYIASHDLQEPLRTIIGFSERLKTKYKVQLDHNGRKYIDFMHSASLRMSDLVSGLLDYSRLGRQLQLELTDSNQVIELIKKDLQSSIEKSGARIVYRHLPKIYAYPMELRLLFQNLVSNAIKFANEDITPHIEIKGSYGLKQHSFSVSDNGIGIAKEDYEKVFTIFQRLHPVNQFRGTGIGLAHCKKIVELHEGEIWLESLPDEGTTFHFTISNELKV